MFNGVKPPSKNSPCPCGSGKKWKRCHGKLAGTPLPLDPMASLLEDVVRPHLLVMRHTAARTWSTTLSTWVKSEEQRDGYDTERLERLIELAWKACVNAISHLDSRFSLQAVRSLPSRVVEAVTQLYVDPLGLATVTRIITAAAAVANGVRWPRVKFGENNGIGIDQEHLQAISKQLPETLGTCLGAASLTYCAQGWYRWAGKGKHIKNMPPCFEDHDFEAIKHWNGEGILLLPAVEMSSDPDIEKAVVSYEARRNMALRNGLRSGMLRNEVELPDNFSGELMWYAGWRGTEGEALPIYVPAFDITFPVPTWYPVPDISLQSWIEQLRPFDDALKTQLGLTCDELHAGLRALGLVIARQTQCSYLQRGKHAGSKVLSLNSPAKIEYLFDAAKHLASVHIRGTLRNSVEKFRNVIQSELSELGWPQPEQLAANFIKSLTGFPQPAGLPKPILFYVIDPMTCVLDLSLWHDFTDACLSIATSGDGDVGNRRGNLFEEQVRNRLIKGLHLIQSEIPWPANREVWEGKLNRGDVDFCFNRHNILFNLDMKSWQRSSDYHVGHHHTIKKRLDKLDEQMAKLVLRGKALQPKLEQTGLQFAHRLDFLIVASPEYLAPDRLSLWYGNQPRVITADELLYLVENPKLLQEIV